MPCQPCRKYRLPHSLCPSIFYLRSIRGRPPATGSPPSCLSGSLTATGRLCRLAVWHSFSCHFRSYTRTHGCISPHSRMDRSVAAGLCCPAERPDSGKAYSALSFSTDRMPPGRPGTRKCRRPPRNTRFWAVSLRLQKVGRVRCSCLPDRHSDPSGT